jgi:membrane-bound lytic murein transglycosylase B
MGQPQFLPSSFRAFAADGDGDGRRDIWTSTPDVLASVASFMARKGWRGGLPGGWR